ncbi:MAG: hypothetical protein ACLSDQ_13435 [Adlercreutzia equolifaciens]
MGIGINVFRPGRPSRAGSNESTWGYHAGPQSALGMCHWPGHRGIAGATAARPRRSSPTSSEVIACTVNYGRWRELGFMPTLGSYEGSSFLTGRAVRIEDAAGTATLEGTAIGVDERGRLLVRTADDTVPVASGEAHVMVMP